MTTDSRSSAVNTSQAGEMIPRVQARRGDRRLPARLTATAALAVLVALSATGCGHHFHVTVHAGQQAAIHLTSKPSR